MEKNVLGRTGLHVSAAGLGCGGHSRLGMFSQGLAHASRIVRGAYENGVNFFDTATAYGTQPAVGQALQDVPRDRYVLSTKFPYRKGGVIQPAAALEPDLDASLNELHTDCIDVYHLHGVRPEDYITARDRFYPELIRMREKGKIRFFGITELFSDDTTHEMLKLALHDDLWDVMMIGYNFLNPSAAKTILPAIRKKQIGTLCMFAVRSALSHPEMLKPDIRKMIAAGQADPSLVKEEHTLDFLLQDGTAQSIPEAAYRFCRHTDGIDVTLTGTGSEAHLEENLRSIAKPPLPVPVLEKLEQMFGRVDCVSGQQDFPHLNTVISK